jgi:hypothetical protein
MPFCMLSGCGKAMSGPLREVLEQIELYGELRDFCGTRYEKGILLAPAIKRRLIALDKRRIKYELTPAGHQYLAKSRARRSVPSPGLRSSAPIWIAALVAAGFSMTALAPTLSPITNEIRPAPVSSLDIFAPKALEVGRATGPVNEDHGQAIVTPSPTTDVSPAVAPTVAEPNSANSSRKLQHASSSVRHRRGNASRLSVRRWKDKR